MAALTAIDLFAGAGGLTLGLEAAGFLSLGAVEVDRIAASTYLANFGPRPASWLGPEHGDITHASPTSIERALRAAGTQQVDLVTAGPPCQGFSRVGRARLDQLANENGAFALDGRNSLYLHALAIVQRLRPRAFLFENVPGVLHLKGKNVAEAICEELDDIGYEPRCALLNAAWYGVPQNRDRVIILAYRRDLGLVPDFPPIRHFGTVSRGYLSHAKLSLTVWRNPTYFVPFSEIRRAPNSRSVVSVEEAFADLPSFTRHLHSLRHGRRYRFGRGVHPEQPYKTGPNSDFLRAMREWPGLPAPMMVTDHFCRWTPRDFALFRKMRQGDRYPDAVAIATHLWQQAAAAARAAGERPPPRRNFIPPYPVGTFKEKWRKLIPTEPSWTVTAHLSRDSYSHIHFDHRQARTITVREAARLQSFPDAFYFRGSAGDMLRQVGNAVPPLVARALAEQIAEDLTGDLLRLADGRAKALRATQPRLLR